MKAFSIRLIAGLILQMEYVHLDKNEHIPLRLVNSSSPLSSPYAGRLQVRKNDSSSSPWGTVCYDHFNDAAAHVVCYNLGFGRAGSFVQKQHGPGSGQIRLNEVRCNGSETDIGRCSHRWGSNNCPGFNYVSIKCDVTECNRGESGCDLVSTACININGSYNCSCKKGFTPLNETTCMDINECSTGQYQCDATTTICLNTVGSYNCSCKEGLKYSTFSSCTDIDECTSEQPPCDVTTTTCHNTGGSYRCLCKYGYRPSTSTSCTDIDECTTKRFQCDMRTTTCHNIDGSYECPCKNGYRRMNSTSCEDINECSTGQFLCDSASTTCVNTEGSYQCPCRSGFENNNYYYYGNLRYLACGDINECNNRRSQCDSASTTCVNTAGSYRCNCKNGYRYSTSSSCTDIDECSTGQHECDFASTTCDNTDGSYRCQCRNGFENNNNNYYYYYRNSRDVTCRDVDECTNRHSRCDLTTTTCNNTVGSYNCSCKKGFQYLNFSSCIDVDECETGGLCDNPNAICINDVGSYHCACQVGYSKENDNTCSDINECISGKSECDPMSTDCINTIGGNYTCSCKGGFTYLNETTCMAVEESSLGKFGAIVGLSVGAFLVLAAIVIVVIVFYWKRRKEVNQPSQRQRSQVHNGSGVENNYGNPSFENNYGNPSVEINYGSPIIYMELDQTALGMGRKTTNNAQMESFNRLPVPTEKPKETAQSPVYGNVQSSIYATVVSSVDAKAQSPIYGNVQY